MRDPKIFIINQPFAGSASLPNARRVSIDRAPPCDLQELGRRLDACKSGRSASIAAVAAYAIDHPYDIAFGASPAIADRCGVSTPTVIRLAQTLGFEGFREMREFFRKPLRKS